MSEPQTYFFQPILRALEVAFRQIETKIPQPVQGLDGRFRFQEQTIQQAIVQKLARLISGLHSVEVLLERGLFQERGMIQRAVDEIEEDIWFLALAVINIPGVRQESCHIGQARANNL
jgi:hypothetical protein